MARSPLTLPHADHVKSGRPDMPTRRLIVLVLAALATGVGSTWALLGERPPFGSVHLGPWEVFPRIGSSDVDPYGRAMLARGAHLPLALGEGIRLTAHADSAGNALTGRCRYLVNGATLPSRGWTIAVVDAGEKALTGRDAAALSDADLVLNEGAAVSIVASATIAPGNWLRVPAGERFGLTLRFYDTPVSSSVGQLSADSLPRIDRLSCQG